MPVFRFDNSLGIGRVKAFLELRCGLTRGTVPAPRGKGAQDQNPASAKKEQRKAPDDKDRRIAEHAESLQEEQRRNYAQTKEIRDQRVEIYRLKNELEAAKARLAENGGEPRAGTLPDFAVIGAPRCGTSQFYGVLTRHPHVGGAARKELHYFDRDKNFNTGLEWYRRCFPEQKWVDGRRTITGEATPRYLADPLVPERVAQTLPEARFIVLLRNPVDRALSHYHLLARRGKAESFEEAVEAEIAWLEQRGYDTGATPGPPTSLVTTGLYVDHLQRWERFFGRERMLVLDSNDFFKRTAETLELAQDFLGLPRREINLESLGSKRDSKYSYDAMNPATRERLQDFFEPYNRRLYEYLDRDLGW